MTAARGWLLSSGKEVAGGQYWSGSACSGTDLGTHDSVEMAMQVVEGRWEGRA
jgi:hypothetical protein